ncbi:MAG TPA: winged helix-turn-helix transcriptional regulator [bacterium]|mgnify:CR=1 FL=1|nr:winged helix-turn-helix transcriptional regulator [bacterium]HOL47015.1 winged helix-turn-helix transcriptional regulator [bacterium]HPQ18483.1 winged helix-turn-helix transcriptional regulator [bacterium]
MSIVNEKEYKILDIIEKEKNVSQRKIANNLGISLGLVNLFLKKLVKKGLIKIHKSSSKKSLKYLLTKEGFKERLNFNLYYLKKNIYYFSNAKEVILKKLNELNNENEIKDIFIFGIDDWSEILFLCAINFNFNILGFINNSNENNITNKFGLKVYEPSELVEIKKPVLILGSIEKKEIIQKNFNDVFFKIIYF